MILRSIVKKSKNVELNKEIKYIHKKELSNLTVNGKKVEEVFNRGNDDWNRRVPDRRRQ